MRRRTKLWRGLVLACSFVVGCSVATQVASAADFVKLCEANQVYDTGHPTTPAEHEICRCVERHFDRSGEAAAEAIFLRVLAARRQGLGLHPSDVDIGELAALMKFADSLGACNASARPNS